MNTPRLLRASLVPSCLAGLLLAIPPCGAFGYDVITIGDSWAGFIANGAPGSQGDSGTGNALQTVLNLNGAGKTVYNGSFYGGTSADHLDRLNEIAARVTLSGATIVYLSSGGNDLLAGKFGGGIHLDHPDPDGLVDEVVDRVGLIVEGILGIRSDIQVVIGGYDYVNMWDTDLTDGGLGTLLRRNYGLGLDGTGYIGLNDPLYPSRLEDVYRPQQAEFGRLLRDVERRRAELGADSRRVHFVENLGVNNRACGYDGLFGTLPAGLARSEYGDYPITVARMGSGGRDPIHLDTTGYELISGNCYDEFFRTAFEDGVLALDETEIQYAPVLVGRRAERTVTACNAGSDFTKIGVRFEHPAVPFDIEENATRYLFRDPTLGSDTVSTEIAFAPTARGEFTGTVRLDAEYGEDSTVAVSGKGVAPVSEVRVTGPRYVRAGTTGSLVLEIANVGDGNLSGLGEESNLRGSMILTGGSGFRETSLADISLEDGAASAVSVEFVPSSREIATATADFDFTNGHRDGDNRPEAYSVDVEVRGVGPVFSAKRRVALGAIEIAASGYESFQVGNLTDDPDGGDTDLTLLTLLGASISGPDADLFEFIGFVPGLAIPKGEWTAGLALRAFNDGTELGRKSATLTLLTDVGAAAGRPGAPYAIDLSAVFVPEPGVFVLLGFLGAGLLGGRRRP